MNERIQELAEEAGMKHPVMGEASLARFDYEKFAQLIVQECISAVHDDGQDAEYYQNRIKAHFGVEQ